MRVRTRARARAGAANGAEAVTDKMAVILAEGGAAFPQLAADQCRAWIQRILKEYEEAHEYLDNLVPWMDGENRIPLVERIKQAVTE